VKRRSARAPARDAGGAPAGAEARVSTRRHPRLGALDALRHREFALFFAAALVSNTGGWLQSIAAPFLLYEVTRSNTWLGLAGFASLAPGILLAPLAGILADRHPRRRILLLTQCLHAGVAAALCGLAAAGAADAPRILGLLLLGGIANGIQMTSWQSYVPLLVPRESLADAVRLNSAQFTISRALGPALGGVVLASAGAAAAFGLNACSFALVLVVLALGRPRPTPPSGDAPALEQVREGVRAVLRSPALRIAVLTAFAVALLGQSVMSLAAGLAAEVFGVGAIGLGAMTSMFGTGAMLGALVLALFPDTVPRSGMTQAGLVCYAGGLGLVAATRQLGFGLAGFLLMGVSHVLVTISLNTSVQVQVADELRGRVMSLYLMGIFAGVPLGALGLGSLGDALGLQHAVRAAAAGLALFALLGLWRRAFGPLDGPPPSELDSPAPGLAPAR
jgi:MFS family permease